MIRTSNDSTYDTGQILSEWDIEKEFKRKGYYCILFANSKRKQLVLSFRGIRLEVSDFFLSDSQISTEVNTVFNNLDIAPQTIFAYMDTYEAVELSNRLGYSLSFTGYAFGAWLAEQCVYFCHRDFERKKDDVRGVTFESPGSLEYLRKLNQTNIAGTGINLTDLDVIQYLNEPSFVNTFNQHLPQVIRVFSNTKKNYAAEAESGFLDFLDKIPSTKIKKNLKQSFDKNIKPKMKRHSFYLNGIKAMFSNNLHELLDLFDPITQSLKKNCYKKIISWPKTDFKPSHDLQEGIADRINKLIEAGFESIPYVPATVTKLGAMVVQFFTKPIINCICDNLFSGVSCIINLIIEFISGNINAEQCLDCFENDQDIMEYREEKTKLFADEKKFRLVYNSHYRIQTNLECFKEMPLKSDNIGSLDYFLFHLFCLKEFGKKINPFIEYQLKSLQKSYKISFTYSH